MIRRVVGLKRTLQRRGRYGYLTPVEKPVTSLAVSSLVELSAEALQYCHLEFAIDPTISVLAGAFACRVGIQFAGLFFQSLTHRKKDTWAHRWIEKIFLVDMRRDATFYVPHPTHSGTVGLAIQRDAEILPTRDAIHWFAEGTQLIIQTYAMLNFMRGGHSLITNIELAPFWADGVLQLSMHDPYFMLPVGVMAVNYLILSGSRHPFFIHLVRKENRLMCFNFAFASGLLFVATPAIYPLSYIGLALGHLTLRTMSYFAKDCKRAVKELFTMKKK